MPLTVWRCPRGSKRRTNTKKKTYKAVCYGLTTLPDDMHVVNFINEKVTFSDDRGEKDGVAYLPSLVGIFAVCNVKRGRHQLTSALI